jgi:hypothetical protein
MTRTWVSGRSLLWSRSTRVHFVRQQRRCFADVGAADARYVTLSKFKTWG